MHWRFEVLHYDSIDLALSIFGHFIPLMYRPGIVVLLTGAQILPLRPWGVVAFFLRRFLRFFCFSPPSFSVERSLLGPCDDIIALFLAFLFLLSSGGPQLRDHVPVLAAMLYLFWMFPLIPFFSWGHCVAFPSMWFFLPRFRKGRTPSPFKRDQEKIKSNTRPC